MKSRILRLALGCIVCGLVLAGWLLRKPSAASALAVSDRTEQRILSVRAAAIPRLEAFEQCLARIRQSDPGSPFRFLYKTTDFPAVELDFSKINGAASSFQPAEYGLDLWQIAADLDAPKDSSLAVTFALHTQTARKIYLGLGASHQYAVFKEGKAIFAAVGGRALLVNQDLCPLDLKPGTTEITIVFQRQDRWKNVPQDHFQPEWSAEIQVFGSAEIAWTKHLENIFRPMDVAILPNWKDIRLEGSAEGFEDVTLHTLNGAEQAKGRAQADGTIAWENSTPLPNGPFFGFLVLGQTIGEPVLVLAGQEIDDAVKSLVPMPPSQNDADAAWHFRLNHLLKPEFNKERNRTWSRKVVQAAVMVALSNDPTRLEAWRQKCPSLRVELHAYRSHIDGTTQYYHLFRCSRRQERVPLVVTLPPVPENVRPYLQSTTIASLPAFETVALQAEQMNVDVLWPGVVDVDYGGLLCQKAVEECLADASRVRGPQRSGGIYLSGICSSGVSAINCSRSLRQVDGVVLHTPVILRNVSKLTGDGAFDTLFPVETLAREAADNDYQHFKNIPVRLLYDTDIFGHGDRQRSREFEAKLKALGVEIDSHWPVPFVSMPWGERDNVIMRGWMTWITTQEGKRKSPSLREEPGPSIRPETVKRAILQGFQVEPTADPTFAHWLAGWRVGLSSYREEAPSAWAGSNAPTTVGFRTLSRSETNFESIKALMSGHPLLEKNGIPKIEIESSAVVFGFRLSPASTDQAARVELLRSDLGAIPPPAIDLLLDTSCRGAIWKYDRGTWALVDVWL